MYLRNLVSMVSKDLTTLSLQGKGERMQTREIHRYVAALAKNSGWDLNTYNFCRYSIRSFQHQYTSSSRKAKIT